MPNAFPDKRLNPLPEWYLAQHAQKQYSRTPSDIELEKRRVEWQLGDLDTIKYTDDLKEVVSSLGRSIRCGGSLPDLTARPFGGGVQWATHLEATPGPL